MIYVMSSFHFLLPVYVLLTVLQLISCVRIIGY